MLLRLRLYAYAGNQYYKGCYIEVRINHIQPPTTKDQEHPLTTSQQGAVDYIFGSAGAWFEACQIVSNGGGAITANGRSTEDDTWYVINNSTVRTIQSPVSHSHINPFSSRHLLSIVSVGANQIPCLASINPDLRSVRCLPRRRRLSRPSLEAIRARHVPVLEPERHHQPDWLDDPRCHRDAHL